MSLIGDDVNTYQRQKRRFMYFFGDAMTFEDRQRQTMADYNRSSFAPVPAGFSRQSKRLDEIAAESERQRQQREAIAKMEADAKRGVTK